MNAGNAESAENADNAGNAREEWRENAEGVKEVASLFFANRPITRTNSKLSFCVSGVFAEPWVFDINMRVALKERKSPAPNRGLFCVVPEW